MESIWPVFFFVAHLGLSPLLWIPPLPERVNFTAFEKSPNSPHEKEDMNIIFQLHSGNGKSAFLR